MRLIAIVIIFVLRASPLRAVDKPPPIIHAYFSPARGSTEAGVYALRHAKKAVVVQAYSVTSAPVAEALVDAHPRHYFETAFRKPEHFPENYP